ncbi:autotransporter adhesin [Variovorax boronicumulans]|uniref:ESPR-type extended signal peptide-containing protein n=1 Tax=Variovorax boronicumulans TaxID=436515 RepID=UPI0027847E66|nr:ESPR-type extended signal peptide-containing protein [Variovorax boronicumulans]MDP9992677.1 autotransporter adhesin [Variovorax boronicumulans]MDQ0004232.1 autotransporter adhesin [Variovorax boronicumulans]
MNRTYRSLWNESLGAWVAASEVSHARGKRGGSHVALSAAGGLLAARPARRLRAGLATALVALSAVGWTSFAEAQVADCSVAPYNAYTGTASCIGLSSKASGIGATALGSLAVSDVLGGLAVGYSSHSAAQNSISLGFGAYSAGINSIYLGARTAPSTGALGGGSIGIGTDVTASGGNAIAAGSLAVATGDNSTAVGSSTRATGLRSLALGFRANAAALDAVAQGNTATASAQNAIAVGFQSVASQLNSVYIGSRTAAGTGATGVGAIAIGTDVTASNGNATAVGFQSKATGASSVAVGPNAAASGTSAMALGTSSVASDINSVALGASATATGAGDSALGTFANASGGNSTAVGVSSSASGARAFAGGWGVNASGVDAAAIGTRANAAGTSSAAFGNLSNASANFSLAMGNQAVSAGIGSVAAGSGASAAADGAVAVGNNAAATLTRSTALGFGTAAGGQNATAVGALASASAAQAVAIGNSAKASALNAIAMGTNAVANSADAVSIGNGSTATGGKAVAIGSGNVANGNGAVAIGDPNTATGDGAIANGKDNTATGNGAVAMGNTNKVGGGGQDISVPGTAAQGAVGIGFQNTVVGQGSVAIGSTSQALAAGAVAFGDTAVAKNAGDVALGSGSKTDTAVGTPSTVIGGTTYLFAGTTPTSTVSVGAPGAERTITNLAAGRISGSSTDAINGSQLYATNQAIQAIAASTPTHYYSVNDGGAQQGNYTNNGATGANALAAGVNASAAGTNSVAVGAGAVTSVGSNQVAVGANANSTGQGAITFGPNASANGTNATAVGAAFSAATGDYSTAFGSNAIANGNGATAIGRSSRATGTSAIAFGTGANTTGEASVSIGATATAIGTAAVAMGSTANASAGGAVAIGASANASATNATSIGNGSQALAASTLALGDSNTVAAAAGVGSIAAGSNSRVLGGTGAVAMGSGNVANGNGAVAIGDPNTATGDGAIAQGKDNTATGNGAVAMGNTNKVGGGGQDVSVPGTAAQGAVGIGFQNTVVGQGSVAIGSTSKALAAGAVAFGDTAVANNARDVALGSGSVTAAAVGTPSATINGKAYNFQGVAPTSTVSVGAGGAERTITNVAAGRISGTSTDAINGSQLFATNSAIEDVATTAGKGWNLSANGEATPQNIAPGGTADFANGSNTTVTRTGNQIRVDVSADPIFNSVTTGNTKIDNNGLTIVGGPSVTTTGINAGGTQITNVAPGVAGTDGVNVDQLNTTVAGSKTKYYSVNSAGGGNEANDGATGTDAIASGKDATAAGNSSVAMGLGATAGTANSVALGSGSVTATPVGTASTTINGTVYNFQGATPVGTVSVGSGGAERTITNVAAGRIAGNSTDAINGSQLFATNAAITYVATTAGKGWNLSANGEATPQNIAPGGTADFADGSNTTVTRTGNQIRVDVVADPIFNSVTTGNTKIDNAGLTIVGGPTVTVTGIDAGSKVITNVAPGVAGTDGVNVDQLTTTVAGSKTKYYSVNSTGGGNETNNGATGTDAIASGKDATAAGNSSVAMGLGATAGTANGVALGAGSVTATPVGTASTTINGTVYNFQGATPVGTVSVGAGGAERTITNVAAGRISGTSTDAINGSQLFATNSAIEDVATIAGKGWNLSANGEATPQNIAPGGTADFADGSNTTVTRTGNQIRVDVVADPTFNSVTTGNTKIDNGGLTIVGGPSVTTTGINAGGTQITNVAPGVAGTDGVNVDQLNTTVTGSKTKYYSVNSAGGGNEANDGATGADAIASGKNATAAGNSSVAMGLGATAGTANSVALGSGSVTATAVGTPSTTINGTTYNFQGVAPVGTVSVGSGGAERTITNVAAGRIAGNSTDAINGSQLFATNAAITDVATTAGKGWNLSANGEATPQNIAPGGTADFANGSNTTVTRTGNQIRVDVSADPIFNSVTTGNTKIDNGGLTIVGGPSVTTTGINAGGTQITNVAPGVAGTDGVNVDQLNTTVTGSKTKYYSVNSTGGGNEANDGATGTDAIASGKNATAAGNSSVAMGLGATAGTANSVALGSGSVTATPVGTASTTINGTTYNFQGATPVGTVSVGSGGAERTITNVAAGRIAGNSTDAINGSQLFATNAAITDVATTAGKGWNLSANGEATPQNIAPGGTADFADGSNTTVTRTGNQIKVDVVADPVFNSVTTGNTKIDNGGLTIVGGPSVTVTGIDAGSKVITNVAPGVAGTDGVNIDQLNTTVAGSKTKYYSVNSTGGGNETNNGATGTDAIASGKDATAAGNSSVAMGLGATAGTANSVALGAGSVTATPVGTASTTINGTVYNFQGVAPVGTVSVGSVGGERTITNVAAGRISGTSTDAINGSQLFATNQSIADVATTAGKGWNLSANGEATPQNIAPGGTADFADGSNTTVTRTGNQIKVDVVADPIFNSVTTGNTKIDNGGLTIVGGPSVTVTGIDAGSKVITNVAPGVAGTDGVNIDQLNSTVAGSKTKYYSVNSTGGGNEANDGATGADAIASGKNATAAGASAVAIGLGATAGTANSVALGAGSSTAAAVGTASTTINGVTYNFQGVAPVGTVSVGSGGAERTITNVAAGRIAGNSTDAINGSQLFATNQSIEDLSTTVTTNKTKYYSVNSTGGGNEDNLGATGTDAIASGKNATAAGNSSVAMGLGATAGTANSVALGAGSVTATAVGTSSTTINGTTYNFQGVSPIGTVSVGTVGGERTLTNVAAGRISGSSTDAINGSQLFATNQSIENLSTTVTANKIRYYSVNSTGGGNEDNLGATGADAIASGKDASATVNGAVAIGSGAVSDRAIASSSGNIPAGSALIPFNTADRTLLGAVSVGSATTYRQITNVADGTQAQDAVTVRQLSGALQSFAVTPIKYFHANSGAADSLAVGAESVAVGPQTVVNGNNGVGIGNGAVVQQSAPGGIAVGQGATSHLADSIAMGTGASAAGVQGVAMGAGSSVTQAGGVALGAGSVASTAAGVAGYVPPTATDAQRIAIGATTSTLAAVSVGNAASGQFRQITGVAAGTADSDAVNVSQLRGVQGTVAAIDQSTVKYDSNPDGSVNYNSVSMGGSNATGPVTVHNVAPGVAGTDAVNVNQLNALGGGLNNRINAVNDRIDGVEKNAYAGVAAAMALQMPGSYVPGKTVMRIGAGSFKGENAVGISFRRTAENNAWSITGGVATSRAGVGATVGAEWVFN